jgi:hypothetical protein
MPTLVMNPIARLPVESKPSCLVDDGAGEAVEVVDGSIVFRPSAMQLNRYYLAELNGQPYLYRKVADDKVEVYGLH